MAHAMLYSLRWLFLITVCLASLSSAQGKKTICRREPTKVGVTIFGGMAAGNFVRLGNARNIKECLNMACASHKGNIAFFIHKICFSVECYNMPCELETVHRTGTRPEGALYHIIEAYPAFRNAPAIAFVDENAFVDKEIISLTVAAESRDRKEETMNFKLEKGNIGNTFRLYPKLSNRRVSIRLQNLLDRETIPAYHLTIRATNTVENVSTLLNIIINITDYNDNPPVFVKSLFVFNVFSNMSVGATIGRLVAKDKDIGKNAQVTYNMTPGSGPVTLDPTTGKVTLKKKIIVDTVQTFQYQVTAHDEFYKTNSRLNVEVYPNNVNRPTFERQTYQVRLNGHVPTDTEVVRVSATDPDYGKLGELTFQITNGNEQSTFLITREGVIKTRKKVPPQIEIYNLTINVHDNAYPELYAIKPVHVVILIQRLRFKQIFYETIVREDFGITDEVFTVNASLWDGRTELKDGQQQRTQRGIKYYLDDGDDLDEFEMGETTGVVSLKKSLDYENRKVYDLELRAECRSSYGSSGRTVLTANATLRLQVLDVNDNAPRFFILSYSQDVWMSSKKDSPVLRMNASDADEGDNGLISYDAVSGNTNDTFTFESDGMIFLRKPLTQIRVSTFNITIAAWDHGKPPLRSVDLAVVSIHVHGSPDAPLFDKRSYSAMVSEGVPIDTWIVQVKASVYREKSRVTYWIRNTGQKLPFDIEPKTGRIITTQRLDREEKNLYHFKAIAITDLGRMSLTTTVNVTISLQDENDNRPIFTRRYYSTILSCKNVGTRVTTVKAIDKDVGANGRILYRITRGHDEMYFTINSRTGLLKIKRSLPSKSLNVLKCYISARDQGRPSLRSLKDIPVYVLIGSTFPIDVHMLTRTTSEIYLRFIVHNVSLEHVRDIGVVVQEYDTITEYEEITKRSLKSWFHIHNAKGNGVYAQRYLTGSVRCTDKIKKTKTFDFNVGADGNKCQTNKKMFCNGQLLAKKEYRFQLVAYFKNDTAPKNVTSVESQKSSAFQTGVNNANRSAGFRSFHYDVIVIVVGIIVGLIIMATLGRAIMLYRKDNYRTKNDEAKEGISYPLSNPRYQRAGEQTPSSRSTLSFTELSKSKKSDRRSEKTSPAETEKLEIVQDENGGVSRDSGCGASVKSSNSDINPRRKPSVRRALFSFGKKDEEQEDDKEMETELNT